MIIAVIHHLELILGLCLNAVIAETETDHRAPRHRQQRRLRLANTNPVQPTPLILTSVPVPPLLGPVPPSLSPVPPLLPSPALHLPLPLPLPLQVQSLAPARAMQSPSAAPQAQPRTMNMARLQQPVKDLALPRELV